MSGKETGIMCGRRIIVLVINLPHFRGCLPAIIIQNICSSFAYTPYTSKCARKKFFYILFHDKMDFKEQLSASTPVGPTSHFSLFSDTNKST